jgi:hypothetical protein
MSRNKAIGRPKLARLAINVLITKLEGPLAFAIKIRPDSLCSHIAFMIRGSRGNN